MNIKMENGEVNQFEIDREVYDHYNAEDLEYQAPPGLTEELVRQISASKKEPEWMLEKRLQGLKAFNKLNGGFKGLYKASKKNNAFKGLYKVLLMLYKVGEGL